MLYNKAFRVSAATNKTISQGKYTNIRNDDAGRHWGMFWMGAEIVKAVIVLFYCSYSLYSKIGYACITPICFILTKMGIDKCTAKWRDTTWRNVGKASDKRSNEIN
jgi:hypothetical protein